MAKKTRGGGHKPQQPARTAAPRPATPKTTPAPPVARADRRIIAVVAGLAVVVLLGGVLVVGSGLGGSATPTAMPTATALAAVPAPEITVKEASVRAERGALLLDVREQDEWDAGHVPGAAHLPLSQLQARLAEVPADRTVLMICRSGNRSAQARDLLLASGLTNVTSVAGGVRAWQAAGYPFEGSVLG